MAVEWRKAFAKAKAEISGEVATDIPAPAEGREPTRVRLYITPRAPEPARAGGVFARLFRDFSDRSERGDPKALFARYGAAFVPMAMSVPFAGAGTAVLILVPRQNPHQVFPYIFGSLFALAGVFLFTMGLSGLRTAAGAAPRSEKEPWRGDKVWDPSGARPDAPGRSVAGCLGGILFLLFIGAFNVMWTVKKDLSATVVFSIVLVVFDLIGLLVVGSVLLALFQRIRAGAPRLSWKRFPFYTGERFEGAFTSGRRLRVTGPVRAILRCVQQTTGENSDHRPEIQPYAVYAKAQTIEPEGGRLLSFPLAFDLPATVPGTDLSTQQSTYWLLEIRAPPPAPTSPPSSSSPSTPAPPARKRFLAVAPESKGERGTDFSHSWRRQLRQATADRFLGDGHDVMKVGDARLPQAVFGAEDNFRRNPPNR
jgi:hypothetical protein